MAKASSSNRRNKIHIFFHLHKREGPALKAGPSLLAGLFENQAIKGHSKASLLSALVAILLLGLGFQVCPVVLFFLRLSPHCSFKLQAFWVQVENLNPGLILLGEGLYMSQERRLRLKGFYYGADLLP
ncbi:hypothetical protein ACD591_01485 [Rufibacter glacialis]|uniref:Uncharacterized protein n=1 Tax=Rufibacter glacialis TaxID=1259555 RepID=A0A5M8QHQ3_9BACT|nr:hypothetical protein [Rufibacter glacialis]KAA6435565.1 hypothetical protein FOE74_06385 [Rufibacter glacialis]